MAADAAHNAFAARVNLNHQRYAWGNDLMPGGKAVANTWEGRVSELRSRRRRASRLAGAEGNNHLIAERQDLGDAELQLMDLLQPALVNRF